MATSKLPLQRSVSTVKIFFKLMRQSHEVLLKLLCMCVITVITVSQSSHVSMYFSSHCQLHNSRRYMVSTRENVEFEDNM